MNVLNSYQSSSAALRINAAFNEVSTVPPRLFQALGTFAPMVSVAITINVSHNPLQTIHPAAFEVTGANQFTKLEYANIILDYPTTGHIRPPGRPFSYNGIEWSTFGGAMLVSLRGTGLNMNIVSNLTADSKAPARYVVILDDNNYTEVTSCAFCGSRATGISLGNNRISRMASDAFNYSLVLDSLDLSHNLLTYIDITFLSNTPALSTLIVANNSLWAMPITNNHIRSQDNASENVLSCDTFGPELDSCRCPAGSVFNVHCGYGRCTSTSTGCARGLMFASGSCADAPNSTCLTSCPRNRYYSQTLWECLPVTVCDRAFRLQGSQTAFLQAYEYESPTITSDRQCSICSTCPSGYETVPCTATSNTQCVLEIKLSIGDIAAIILAVVLLAIGMTAGFLYGRKQSREKVRRVGCLKLGIFVTSPMPPQVKTQDELELTARLLGDVQDENTRVTEENVLMEQAWTIAESDLTFGESIGEGGFGTVFRGSWGHIPVAIKVRVRTTSHN